MLKEPTADQSVAQKERLTSDKWIKVMDDMETEVQETGNEYFTKFGTKNSDRSNLDTRALVLKKAEIIKGEIDPNPHVSERYTRNDYLTYVIVTRDGPKLLKISRYSESGDSWTFDDMFKEEHAETEYGEDYYGKKVLHASCRTRSHRRTKTIHDLYLESLPEDVFQRVVLASKAETGSQK